MLNRKGNKASGAKSPRRSQEPAEKPRPVRHRFIISSKSAMQSRAQTEDHRSANGHSKNANGHGKTALPQKNASVKNPGQKAPNATEQNPSFTLASAIDLTETIKQLLQLQQENGYVTYDDINDILPDNLSPDDLDELYTKLRSLDVEIVDQAEVERAKPAPQEEDEDARLEILDDPVRMYMNQMGKVPLLTREQEVEICKRIEDAEIEMKRIIYGLGFAAKEHIAISEKLLSEPPKERFDRVVVDKQVANRDRHLRNLRTLIKKVRVMDQNVDKKYLAFCKVVQKSRREKLQKEFLKLDKKVQAMFPKFFYKQKVVEEMIVVAGNVHEKFQASLPHPGVGSDAQILR